MQAFSDDRAGLRRLRLEARDDLLRRVAGTHEPFGQYVGGRLAFRMQTPLVRRCLDIDLWHRVLHEDQVTVARHSSFRMKLQVASASIAVIQMTLHAT